MYTEQCKLNSVHYKIYSLLYYNISVYTTIYSQTSIMSRPRLSLIFSPKIYPSQVPRIIEISLYYIQYTLYTIQYTLCSMFYSLLLCTQCTLQVYSMILSDLDFVPLCLNYWYNKTDPGGKSLLIFGDDCGSLHILQFLTPLKGLFEAPSKKQEGHLKIGFKVRSMKL